LLKLSRTLEHVLRKYILCKPGKGRPLHQGSDLGYKFELLFLIGTRAKHPYLAVEGNGSLVESKLLWVPDVRKDDPLKRQTMVALFEAYTVLFGFDGELTTDSVLYIFDSGVESVDSEASHFRCRRTGQRIRAG